jgi:uncharacterized protein YndB with AHSA1/START domain
VAAVSAAVTVATPSDRAVLMTRSFDAGAHGWTIVEARIDLRVGGAWRFAWQGPGGATMAAGGLYREIVTPSRLSYTESFDDHWYPGQALVGHDFTEQDGTTTLTTTHLFDSRQARDLVIASPMARGVSEGYETLHATIGG